MTAKSKQVKLRYFAILKDQAKKSDELYETSASTVRELFTELCHRYHFSLNENLVRVAINQEYREFSNPIVAGDEIVFIPPVAGG